MGNSFFSTGSAPRPHRKAAGFQPSPIVWVLFHLCVHPLMQNNQISRVNTYGEGACFTRSATTRPKVRSPSASQFWGSPLFMPTPFNAERPRWQGNTWEGMFLGVSHAAHPIMVEVQRSPILGFSSIYVQTLRRRTTKFGVATHMGRGVYVF